MPFWKRRKWDEAVDEKYGDYYRDGPARPKRTLIPSLIAIALTGGVFLGLVRAVGGPTMFEKTLTALAAPCGMLWMLLIILIFFSIVHKHRGATAIALVCFVLLSLAGNQFVANQLARYLESDYITDDVMKMEPLETVVLLGGGTGTSAQGFSQVNDSGDRVVTCARMFHAGLINNIICTGSQPLKSMKKDLHPSEEAKNILVDLGVPEWNVSMMRGDNTSAEMQNLRSWLDANPEPGRIGILTSAWHLPRAIRLAKANGIYDAIPIPADVRSAPFVPSPNLLIPSADNLDFTRLAIKEIIAGWLGR